MKPYKLPPLPEPKGQTMFDMFCTEKTGHWHTDDAMRQYAEQAVAPLLAEIERLEKSAKDWERRYIVSLDSVPSTGIDANGYRRW